jgi:hypothetical protein
MQMDEPCRFLFTFPCWVLGRSFDGTYPKSVALSDPNIGIVGSPSTKTVAVFTDKAGVEEFAEAIQIGNPIFIGLDSVQELVKFLNKVKSKYERVALDPRAKPRVLGPVRAWDIGELIRSLSSS